jgi:mediator of RNA polymerase II transcription subunit 21
MGDRLTQLQDAVDQVCDAAHILHYSSLRILIIFQLAQQFVAGLHFVHRRHDLETLGPGDKIRDVKQEQDQRQGTALFGQAESCVRLT